MKPAVKTIGRCIDCANATELLDDNGLPLFPRIAHCKFATYPTDNEVANAYRLCRLFTEKKT